MHILPYSCISWDLRALHWLIDWLWLAKRICCQERFHYMWSRLCKTKFLSLQSWSYRIFFGISYHMESSFIYGRIVELFPRGHFWHDNIFSHGIFYMQLRPNFADAWSNLASAYMRKGRFNEAAQCCRQALALNPRLVSSRSFLYCIN